MREAGSRIVRNRGNEGLERIGVERAGAAELTRNIQDALYSQERDFAIALCLDEIVRLKSWSAEHAHGVPRSARPGRPTGSAVPMCFGP